MDLAAYDDPEVEEALLATGSDASTPGTVASSIGESLAEIWLRRDRFNADAFERLLGEARHEAGARILVSQPAWLQSRTTTVDGQMSQ